MLHRLAVSWLTRSPVDESRCCRLLSKCAGPVLPVATAGRGYLLKLVAVLLVSCSAKPRDSWGFNRCGSLAAVLLARVIRISVLPIAADLLRVSDLSVNQLRFRV